MPEIRTGGCQCGAVRYELSGEPLPLVIRHCHECQKQTSSAFGMTLPVARADLRILSGDLKEWRRLADSGREVACFFCPDCGLKPGTLDDTGWLDPVAEVWTQAAQPWLQLSNDLVSVAREADDIPAVVARWESRKGGA